MSNCINCGAPIDLKLDSCPYCDSPYSRDDQNKKTQDLYQAAIKAIRDNDYGHQLILKSVGGNALTKNEARNLAGLKVIRY